MRVQKPRAFTIIELLVVVSIIALLIGILLPAIGKARDQARLTTSMTNLRNLGTAHETYAAEFADKAPTIVNNSIASYGYNGDAFVAFAQQTGIGHPNYNAGWGPDGSGQGQYLYRYVLDGSFAGHHNWAGNPIVYPGIGSGGLIGWGLFRVPNLQLLNNYLGGRWYDPVWYAPKDTVPFPYAEQAFSSPYEYVPGNLSGGEVAWASYIWSPAAMYSPDSLSYNSETGMFYTDPWTKPGGMRTPAMSAALFPSLKTLMLEHHWLQNRRTDCNPGFTGGYGGNCEPWYFNHGWASSPMAVFFDGHVQSLGVREAELADARVTAQSEIDGDGLWSRNTPFGTDGYFIEMSYDFANTSFHILTMDGIRGRDKVGQ